MDKGTVPLSSTSVKSEDPTLDHDDKLDALFDEGELERILNSEASQVQREAEVSQCAQS